MHGSAAQRDRRIRVRFRPEAEADLNALFEYLLGETAPRVAGDYVRRVHAACTALQDFPNRGAPRSDLGPGVRLIGFERRVAIAYRVEPDEVVILAVLYGGRDLFAVLRDER